MFRSNVVEFVDGCNKLNEHILCQQNVLLQNMIPVKLSLPDNVEFEMSCLFCKFNLYECSANRYHMIKKE